MRDVAWDAIWLCRAIIIIEIGPWRRSGGVTGLIGVRAGMDSIKVAARRRPDP